MHIKVKLMQVNSVHYYQEHKIFLKIANSKFDIYIFRRGGGKKNSLCRSKTTHDIN